MYILQSLRNATNPVFTQNQRSFLSPKKSIDEIKIYENTGFAVLKCINNVLIDYYSMSFLPFLFLAIKYPKRVLNQIEPSS